MLRCALTTKRSYRGPAGPLPEAGRRVARSTGPHAWSRIAKPPSQWAVTVTLASSRRGRKHITPQRFDPAFAGGARRVELLRHARGRSHEHRHLDVHAVVGHIAEQPREEIHMGHADRK